MLKTKVKIIGYGDVVRRFLATSSSLAENIDLEIYSKSPIEYTVNTNVKILDICNFEKSNDFIIFCASTNERELLSRDKSRSRLAVATENLKIIDHFIKKGIFDEGTIFVLTNPSEAIAQYIFEKVGNRNIYALGTHYDKIRYLDLLKSLSENEHSSFNILGHHYLSPILQLDHNSKADFVESLREKLDDKIVQEFKNGKPPIESGAQNIRAVINGIAQGGRVSISGYDKTFKSFISGSLSLKSNSFSSNKPSNRFEYKFIQNSIDKHHTFLNQVLGLKL